MMVLVERNARCNDVGRRQRATSGSGNQAKDFKKMKEEIATTNNIK
jgi:hypothetical protein